MQVLKHIISCPALSWALVRLLKGAVQIRAGLRYFTGSKSEDRTRATWKSPRRQRGERGSRERVNQDRSEGDEVGREEPGDATGR